ncbi:hypothetical protein J4558_18800 [Leptolyngbya sp. 15MV]|nr:hypothetical protein J4558_18800 [Leptolyngbya sp. 15MV]
MPLALVAPVDRPGLPVAEPSKFVYRNWACVAVANDIAAPAHARIFNVDFMDRTPQDTRTPHGPTPAHHLNAIRLVTRRAGERTVTSASDARSAHARQTSQDLTNT